MRKHFGTVVWSDWPCGVTLAAQDFCHLCAICQHICIFLSSCWSSLWIFTQKIKFWVPCFKNYVAKCVKKWLFNKLLTHFITYLFLNKTHKTLLLVQNHGKGSRNVNNHIFVDKYHFLNDSCPKSLVAKVTSHGHGVTPHDGTCNVIWHIDTQNKLSKSIRKRNNVWAQPVTLAFRNN